VKANEAWPRQDSPEPVRLGLAKAEMAEVERIGEGRRRWSGAVGASRARAAGGRLSALAVPWREPAAKQAWAGRLACASSPNNGMKLTPTVGAETGSSGAGGWSV